MIGVLFVCLGNICRSPMAEAVFRQLVEEEGLSGYIRTDSAGTGNWHVGNPPHHGTRRILDRHHIDYAGIRARQLNHDDFEAFRYIVAMDADNMKAIRALKPDPGPANVIRLLDLVPQQHVRDVPDPYYTGNFEEVYELVQQGCRNLLAYVRQRENLS